MTEHLLVHHSSATAWVEALPLGNGRLGAMCFGDPVHDRFALNDDTVWSGSTSSERVGGAVPREVAAAALEEARAAVQVGDLGAADRAVRGLQQRYSQAFLPLGDLHLTLADDGASWAVRRELDLATATHTLTAERPGQRLERTAFTSAPDGVLVVTTRVHGPALDLAVRLTSPLDVLTRRGEGDALELAVRAPADVAPTHEPVDVPIRYDDDPLASVRAVVATRLLTDGTLTHDGELVRVHDATHLTLLLTTATTFVAIGEPPHGDLGRATAAARERLDAAAARPLDDLHARHVTDHARLYDRVELDVRPSAAPAAGSPSDAPALDTAERLRAAWDADGHPLTADPGLGALLFHYGRYLLIASSRPGTLPANLQGVWNDRMQPPWSSNYTVNINTQMNYWGAEVTGLAECHEPLFDLVDALARNGTEIAQRLYGARGWVAHHNADAWAFASPVGMGVGNPAWAFWPMAGLWLARHHCEHIAHGAPRAFAERAWRVVGGAVAAGLDLLEEIEPGVLGTVVSSAPENEVLLPDGSRGGVARASTMDIELLRDACTGLLELAALLGHEDDVVVREAREALPHLAPLPVGADGGIAEWFDDPPTFDPTHRHVSMLYGLFPGAHQLTEAERAAAVRRLEIRGDEATGWSLAWKMALWARLGRADKVEDLLALMVRDATEDRGPWSGGLYLNLFSAAPPFQIDANLGYVGAVAEALVQSHRGRIELLPALPAVWHTGTVRGLIARPGVVVDLRWADGALTDAVLCSAVDRVVDVEAAGRAHRLELKAGVAAHVPLDRAGNPPAPEATGAAR